MTDSTDGSSIARDDIVLFVELDADGSRILRSCGGGTFTAPDAVIIAATDLLSMLVDLDTVRLGSQIGYIRVEGHGETKEIHVRAAVDESTTREGFEYDPHHVTNSFGSFPASDGAQSN